VTKKYSFFDIAFFSLPLSFLVGAAAVETLTIIISITFLIENFKEKKCIFLANQFLILFLIFIFFCTLSSYLNAYDSNKSIFKSISYFRYLIFFFAVDYFIKKKKENLKIIFFSILVTVLIASFSGILEFFFRKYLSLTNDKYNSRISGIFGDELILGSFIVSFYFLLLLIMQSLKLKFNIYYKLFFLLSFFVVIMTNDRLITIKFLTISILAQWIIVPKKFIRYTYLILSFIVLLFLFNPERAEPWLKFGSYVTYNIKNLIVTADTKYTNEDKKKFILSFQRGGSNYDYFKLFRTGIFISKDKFPLGTGVRNFRHECKDNKYSNQELFSCGTHPHNLYIEILSEGGIFALISIICMILMLVNIIIKQKKINRIKKFHMIAILFIFFWPISTTGSFFNNFGSAILWLNLGVINSLLSFHNRK
jgi:O-antigen ligase